MGFRVGPGSVGPGTDGPGSVGPGTDSPGNVGPGTDGPGSVVIPKSLWNELEAQKENSR